MFIKQLSFLCWWLFEIKWDYGARSKKVWSRARVRVEYYADDHLKKHFH